MMNYYNDIIIKIFDDFSAVIEGYLELLDTKSSGTESESDLTKNPQKR